MAPERPCSFCGRPFAYPAQSGRRLFCDDCGGAKASALARRLRHRYNLSPQEFLALLERCGGECEACGRVPTRGEGRTTLWALNVDHDHETGHIRGLLCNPCNYALGCVEHDPDRLEALARYLRLRSEEIIPIRETMNGRQ